MGRFNWLDRGVQDIRISQSGIKELFWVEVINCHADKVIPNLYESDLKEHLDHGKMISDKLHLKLYCTKLFGTTVSVGPSCVNVSCTKALQIVPGSRIVTCISCNRTMRVDVCPCIFNCQLAFADITLSLPVDVASKYFKEDVVELSKKDETGFWMTLCLLESIGN